MSYEDDYTAHGLPRCDVLVLGERCTLPAGHVERLDLPHTALIPERPDR